MTGLSVLTEVNRWVGVAVALVGAVVVAPEGTRLLLRSIWAWIRRRGQEIRGQLARFLPFLRRSMDVRAGAASGNLTAGAALVTTWGSVLDWRPGATVEERLEALREWVNGIKKRVGEIAQLQTQETANREQAIDELRADLSAQIADLRWTLDEQQDQAARIDARGLPVIGWGILLSGIPDRLAQIPFMIGWVFPIVGVILGLAAGVPAWREYRGRAALSRCRSGVGLN
ncbi:MAG: hypothetical protein H0T66_17670 [Geodermatophilaceae bacterium]|nr:hypothetical protein [Geodermatophilaceae bacterium]